MTPSEVDRLVAEALGDEPRRAVAGGSGGRPSGA